MTDATTTEPAGWHSTAQAARSSGLTRDYIAQLCRVGKVRGEFIQKNWYIEPESLDTFLIEAERTKAERRTAAAIERKGALSSAIAKEVWESRRQKLFAAVLALTLTAGAATLASAGARTVALRAVHDLSGAAVAAYDALAHRSAEAQLAAANPTAAFAQFRDTLIGSAGALARTWSAHVDSFAIRSARTHAAQLAAAGSPSLLDRVRTWINGFLFPPAAITPTPTQTRFPPPPAPYVASAPAKTPTSTTQQFQDQDATHTTNSSRQNQSQTSAPQTIVQQATVQPLAAFGTANFIMRSELSGLLNQFKNVVSLLPQTVVTRDLFTRQTERSQESVVDSLGNYLSLGGGTLSDNLTVNGVTGLIDADIPDGITASNYLPLSGGTIAGGLTVSGAFTGGTLTLANASTSIFSAFGPAYFGGTATSTFGTDGSLTLAGALTANGDTTLTNATSTSFFATTASSTNLYAGAGSIAALSAGTLALTNALPFSSGGTGTTTWQTGSIPFFSGTRLTENNSYLFWDNTNSKRGKRPGNGIWWCGIDKDTRSSATH